MKKKIVDILCVICMASCLFGCTEQGMTYELGGSMTLELPANEKLEEITWKDDNLWYLTRPMREDEEAETHTFHESSSYGVFEGTVTIIEKKED